MRRVAEAELPDVVDAELRRVLDASWIVERLAHGEWQLRPPPSWARAPSGSPYYRVLACGAAVVITHGNSDAGAFTDDKLVQRATLVEGGLDPAPSGARLGELILRVLRKEPPNVEGLT